MALLLPLFQSLCHSALNSCTGLRPSEPCVDLMLCCWFTEIAMVGRRHSRREVPLHLFIPLLLHENLRICQHLPDARSSEDLSSVYTPHASMLNLVIHFVINLMDQCLQVSEIHLIHSTLHHYTRISYWSCKWEGLLIPLSGSSLTNSCCSSHRKS